MRAAMEKQRAAIALQREAARKQAEFANRYRWTAPMAAVEPAPAPAPAEVVEAGCPALPESAVVPMLRAAAESQEVSFDLLRAVVRQESAFRPCAVSAKGAKGLMQLMPATMERFSVADPFHPEENLNAGARYLKELLGRYKGDLALALGAYNAGPGNISESGGLPDFAETRNYVSAILRELQTTGVTPRPPPASPANRPDPPAAQ